jgi:phosphomannomutase/phosphoglucomutase
MNAHPIAPVIFKAYDVRGIVDQTLTESAVRAIGQSMGLLARERGVSEVVIGRDGRLSGPRLVAALTEGLLDAGVDVIDIGAVTTPMVYFAAFELGCGTGVAVTGSHNPPEYNGLKMMVAGEALYGDAIQALRLCIEAGLPAPVAQRGARRELDLLDRYRSRIVGDVRLARPMRIAIDCGNGIAGAVAPALFRALGCEVAELFCEVDGHFPNHHPDPARPENLADLIACLARGEAELGLAFDGDGDRLGVVTPSGSIIYPDRQLMLFARDILSRHPGAQIIYDVKCSRNLGRWISEHGGRPLMWRTGHSLVKAKLKETGAPFAGEMSGHIFFKERWYGFDDGLYAGARLLEIVSRATDPGVVLEALPDSLTTPELQLPTAEEENVSLVETLKREARFEGFGLARPSNTTPVVVIRFEADSAAAMARIQRDFRAAILAAKPDAALPF